MKVHQANVVESPELAERVVALMNDLAASGRAAVSPEKWAEMDERSKTAMVTSSFVQLIIHTAHGRFEETELEDLRGVAAAVEALSGG